MEYDPEYIAQEKKKLSDKISIMRSRTELYKQKQQLKQLQREERMMRYKPLGTAAKFGVKAVRTGIKLATKPPKRSVARQQANYFGNMGLNPAFGFGMAPPKRPAHRKKRKRRKQVTIYV